MYLFVGLADCVTIGHFEGGKVLDLYIETIIKLLNIFSLMLILHEKVVLHLELVRYFDLKLANLLLYLGATLTFPQHFYLGSVEEVKQDFVDIELEGSGEPEGEEVVANHGLDYSLHKLHSRALPLQQSLLIFFGGSGVGRLRCHFLLIFSHKPMP